MAKNHIQKHTPQPWIQYGKRMLVFDDGNQRIFVATVLDNLEGDFPLIRAAPKLLTKLIELAERVRPQIEALPSMRSAQEHAVVRAYEEMVALIREAGGQID